MNKSIEQAQKRVEQQNFSIRKRTLDYDDVMNRQREVIYEFRGDIVRSQNVREHLYSIIWDVIENKALEMLSDKDESGPLEFVTWAHQEFPIAVKPEEVGGDSVEPAMGAELVYERVKKAYELKSESEDPEASNSMERLIMLRAIDSRWQDFLRGMDSLREGVGLRAYGQQDPLVEYKREAYSMFETLMTDIKEAVASQVFRAATSAETFEKFVRSLPRTLVHDQLAILGSGTTTTRSGQGDGGGGAVARVMPSTSEPFKRQEPKVGRNDPCPCGSGKKYKKCCGAK